MEDIWRVIKKYPKTNIIVVSLIATILIINETLEFTERLKWNIPLIILSLILFFCSDNYRRKD